MTEENTRLSDTIFYLNKALYHELNTILYGIWYLVLGTTGCGKSDQNMESAGSERK